MTAVPPPPPPPQMELPKVHKSVDAQPDPRSALLDAIRNGKTLKVCTHSKNNNLVQIKTSDLIFCLYSALIRQIK